MPPIRFLALTGGWLLVAPSLQAQSRNPADTVDLGSIVEQRIEMIPMRDGARLYTEIYLPRAVHRSRCPS